MKRNVLEFNLTRKQLINANDSSKGNWRVKMGVVNYLRTASFEKGKLIKESDPSIYYRYLKVKTVVFPPTRRRLDPPNFAPTTKALIDGLTDAEWWEDDDFTHVLESSFVYGGLSGEKDKFKIILIIEEIPEDEAKESYVLETEKSNKYYSHQVIA